VTSKNRISILYFLKRKNNQILINTLLLGFFVAGNCDFLLKNRPVIPMQSNHAGLDKSALYPAGLGVCIMAREGENANLL
jgi:hypothetical protein